MTDNIPVLVPDEKEHRRIISRKVNDLISSPLSGTGTGLLVRQSDAVLYEPVFGVNPDYSTFEADGTLVSYGAATVWEDQNFAGVALGTGASPPSLIQLNGHSIYVAAFDGVATVEQLFGGTELPHAWKVGTDIYPHLHWSATTADAGNVKWQLSYQWLNNGDTAGTDTTVSVTQAAPAVAWKVQRADFPAISGTGKNKGSQLMLRLFRDPTDGADTYAHNAAITATFGFHYERDMTGSRTKDSK